MLTPFPEARALILAGVVRLNPETVSLQDLGGRVLAEPVVAPFDVPQFDNSQVDGYAVRTADGAADRQIVGISGAGDFDIPTVGPAQAIRILTGALLPVGADAIVMQEDVRLSGTKLELDAPPHPSEFIRRRGEEIRQGESFDTAGLLATPPVLGLAASFGLTSFRVFRRPKIAIVATGNELALPGQPLRPGQIYASNPIALAEALRGLGLPDVQTFLVGDAPAETERALNHALESSDVLLTVGGISVGDRDLVRAALTRIGVEERLWRIDMKPGKPFYFGLKDSKAVFGLPGNPVSALVTFYTLVRPALRKIMGLRDAEEETSASLATRIDRTDLRYELVRGTVQNGFATPTKAQGSHMQTGLAFADVLLHLPTGIAAFEPGTSVKVTPLRW